MSRTNVLPLGLIACALANWLSTMEGAAALDTTGTHKQTTSSFVPKPAGPYASWPLETRAKATRSVIVGCILSEGMGLAGFRGDVKIKREILETQAAVCAIDQMPDDWPGRCQYEAKAMEHFQIAHFLEPKYLMPTFKSSSQPCAKPD